MKHFPKKSLPVAVAAAFAASAMMVAPAHAVDVDAPFGTSATGTGQIATAYYIAQPLGGWSTFLNVTNTSDTAIAVKVRFKEFKNSREGLDFVVMMSPFDVWTASVSLNEFGEVIVNSTDNSCIAPINMYNRMNNVAGNGLGQRLLTEAFFGGTQDDGGNVDPTGTLTPAQVAAQRNTEGHIELVVMGECSVNASDPGECFGPGSVNVPGEPADRPGIGFITEHVDGVPRDCRMADQYFLPRVALNQFPAPGGTFNDDTASGDPIAAEQGGVGYSEVSLDNNPLKVNVAYIQVGDGSGASVNALHFDSVIGANNEGDNALVTAQRYPWNLEPTIATAPSGTLWDIRELLNFEQHVTWTNTMQEWSVNPLQGVQTSIVINFPTKAYHVDQTCNEPYASNNAWRNDGTDVLNCATAADAVANNVVVPGRDYSPSRGAGAPDAVDPEDAAGLPTGVRNGVTFPPTIAPFTNRWASGASNVRFYFDAFDREEFWVNETQVSPGRDRWDLPWEVAQIVFDRQGGALGAGSPAQVFISAAEELGAINGWIDILFESATLGQMTTAYGADNLGEDQKGDSYLGLPMQGLMIKTRSLGIPGTSYGQGNDNGFRYELITNNP